MQLHHTESTAQEHLENFVAAKTWNIGILSLVGTVLWRITTFTVRVGPPQLLHTYDR